MNLKNYEEGYRAHVLDQQILQQAPEMHLRLTFLAPSELQTAHVKKGVAQKVQDTGLGLR
jgi:hypothetical protein